MDYAANLIEAAVTCKTSPKCAAATVNGKTVEATVVEQYRRTTSRATQKPSIRWAVNGKRVAAADLEKAIAA
jgi:hypothetical protein